MQSVLEVLFDQNKGRKYNALCGYNKLKELVKKSYNQKIKVFESDRIDSLISQIELNHKSISKNQSDYNVLHMKYQQATNDTNSLKQQLQHV